MNPAMTGNVAVTAAVRYDRMVNPDFMNGTPLSLTSSSGKRGKTMKRRASTDTRSLVTVGE